MRETIALFTLINDHLVARTTNTYFYLFLTAYGKIEDFWMNYLLKVDIMVKF